MGLDKEKPADFLGRDFCVRNPLPNLWFCGVWILIEYSPPPLLGRRYFCAQPSHSWLARAQVRSRNPGRRMCSYAAQGMMFLWRNSHQRSSSDRSLCSSSRFLARGWCSAGSRPAAPPPPRPIIPARPGAVKPPGISLACPKIPDKIPAKFPQND